MDTDTIDSNGATGAADQDASEAHTHPEFPNIASPDKAAEFLTYLSVDDLKSQAGVSVSGNPSSYPQRASLGTLDGYCRLSWQGPLDSKWDWVAILCRTPSGNGNIRNGQYKLFVYEPLGRPTGWQWAVNGSPYRTGLTNKDIVDRGGTDARALYFVWKSRDWGGWYASTEPVDNSVMTPGTGQDKWIQPDDPLN